MKRVSRFVERHISSFVFSTLLLIVIISSFENYLLFHSMVEFISIIISFLIFVIAWYTRKISSNNYLLFLGVAFFFVGIVDILHTLSYEGVGIFNTQGANLSTQFWIAGRYLQAMAFFVAPLAIKKKINPSLEMAIFFVVTTSLIVSIFSGNFPQSYVQGVGLTEFKRVSEYLVAFLMAVSIVFLFQNKKAFAKSTLWTLASGIAFSVLAEITFTEYLGVYDAVNRFGHILRAISYYLIFKALVESSLVRPYSTLFRNLRQKEKKVVNLNENLTVLNKLLRHDILNELTVIELNIELFKSKHGRNENIDAIYHSAKRSEELISHVRNVETIFLPKVKIFKKYDLVRVIEKVAESYPRLPVEIEGSATVMADDLIYPLFDNLTRNALAHGRTKKVLVKIRKRKEFVYVNYSDYGKGIPTGIENKIFKEGFVFGKTGNTGMGLYVVRKTVERYGGKISYKRNKPEGATFVVKLPKAPK